MALNAEHGIGFTMTAKDQTRGVFGNIRKGLRRLRGEGKEGNQQMQAMGRAMVGFAATRIIGPFKSAIREAREFGKAIGEVTTLVDDAVFPMERMEKITTDLAATYGVDAKEQAKALYQTISSGVSDAADATALMDTANKLAVGGVTNVSTAVDGLTNLVNAFAASEVTAADAADAMFVAIKAGKTTAEELSGSLGKLAPIASAAGIGMDEMLASIAAVTTQGISTRETISGLKAAIGNILKPSSQAAAEAKKLGIEFSAAALRSKGLVKFMGDITGSANFTEDSMVELFGSIEGLNAALAITVNEGAKVNEVMDQMAEKAGATDVAFGKMAKTFDFQMKRYDELKKNVGRLFGTSLKKMLAPFIGFMVRIMEGIENFFKSIPKEARDVIVGIVTALAGLIALTGGIMLVRGAMSMLGMSLGGLITGFAQMIIFGGPLLIMLAGAGVAILALQKAFSKSTDGISSAWFMSMDKIKLAWKGVVALFTGKGFSDELQKELDKAGNEGVVGFLNMVQRTMERLKVFWEGLKAGFDEGVQALSESSVFKDLIARFQGLFDMFSGEGAESSAAMLDRWGAAGESAGKKLASLGETAVKVIDWMMDAGKAVADALKDVTAEDITQGIRDFVDAAEALYSIFSAIGSVLRTIYNLISIFFKTLYALSDVTSEFTGTLLQHIFGEREVTRGGEVVGFFDKLKRDFAGKDPFAGVGMDVGDIARTWGSETRMGYEEADEETERVETRKRAETRFEVIGKAQDLIASRQSEVLGDVIARGRERIASAEKEMAGAATRGDTERGQYLAETIEGIGRVVEQALQRQQELKVYINADDMRSATASAEEEDAARNLDGVEVASFG